MKQSILFAVAAALVLSTGAYAEEKGHGGDHAPHWGYTGEGGPSHWGDLDDKYHMCKAGNSQSPIDIGAETPHQDATPLNMSYKPTNVRVVNNGHTIQANYDAGSTLTVDGKVYNLLQFHFHSPSEHTYKGKPYPLEAHLVHKADDGSLAVVGVLIRKGRKNAFLEQIWNQMPTMVNHEMGSGTQNVADFLPSTDAYWHYSGSLTTPPCSEGVKWFVMDKSTTASPDQIDKFLGLIHENARPVQPLNDRAVVHRK
ncbi:MAG: carbonic anhydrase family protein [Nitrospirota bacterium]|nr:carbonic anhydrase family protein [Nitrospirota bacterium]